MGVRVRCDPSLTYPIATTLTVQLPTLFFSYQLYFLVTDFIFLAHTRVPRQLTVRVPFPEGAKLRAELCEQVLEVRSGAIKLDAAPRRAWVLAWQNK